MFAALKTLLRHALYALRGGFLVRPLATALLFGAFGIVIPFCEREFRFVDPWVARLPFAKLLDTAFGQILHYGRSDAAVVLRVLRALGDIASATTQPAYLEAVRARADRAKKTCEGELPEEARWAFEERLEKVFRVTEGAKGG
jgi:uncharacterized membrane protein